MNAFVIEDIMGFPKKFLVCLPLIQSGIMLSRHELDILYFQTCDYIAKPGQALPSFFIVIRGMCEISGKDDEIRLSFKTVTAAMAFLRVPAKSGLTFGPLNPQWVSDS